MSKNKIVVYTALIGDKDLPRRDILCFDQYDRFKNNIRNAKIYKILAHQYVDADISVWVDANIKIVAPIEQLVEEMLGDADIGLFKHFARTCVYREGVEAAGKYPDPDMQSEILDHLDEYRDKEWPKNSGLYECGVLVRRHSRRMEDFNNAWWSEICRHSFRDQLSFPYVLAKFPDIKVNAVDSNVRINPMFSYRPH